MVGGESQADVAILPVYPAMFKIACLRGIENNTILLKIKQNKYSDNNLWRWMCCQCERCMSTDTYGIKSQISKCSSHFTSRTIKKRCTSVNNSQEDATDLHKNLHSILRHFGMSLKSNQLLNNTLDVPEISNIIVLNWESTRMAGFMDVCSQTSKIIVPFLDTIAAGGIRSKETEFAASPKGVHLLQLFADLKPVLKKN